MSIFNQFTNDLFHYAQVILAYVLLNEVWEEFFCYLMHLDKQQEKEMVTSQFSYARNFYSFWMTRVVRM